MSNRAPEELSLSGSRYPTVLQVQRVCPAFFAIALRDTNLGLDGRKFITRVAARLRLKSQASPTTSATIH
jgi:hypothetical protein